MKPGFLYGRVARVHVGALVAAALLLVCTAGVFAQEPMDCIVEDEGMTNVDYLLFVPGLVLTVTNLVLVSHNASKLSSDEPSGLGGGGGILVGALGTVYGALCIGYSDEAAVEFTGLGCMIAGAASIFYGVRSVQASNRKYDEENKQGMVIDPILIDDGTGRLGPGVQVSWLF